MATKSEYIPTRKRLAATPTGKKMSGKKAVDTAYAYTPEVMAKLAE